LGTAMLVVEIPAGLKARLIAHTSAERGTVLRRRAYRYVALAASVFLAVGIAAGIFTANRPRPNVSALAVEAENLAQLMRFEAGVGFGRFNPEQAEANKAAVR